MSGILSGRVAIVTAAGQGIGRATAELFVAHGATVFATDRDANLVADINGARPARLDVVSDDEITAFFKTTGPVDILFNCAGMVPAGTILESTDDDWSRAIDLNLLSMVRTIRAVLPGMIERRSGSVINMSSVASSIKGVPNRCVYGATKASVIGLTKAVAADVVGSGVRCNAVCPGTVDTPSLRERLHATGDFEQAWNSFIARQPMGRLGLPQEIAELVLYLASPASDFVTGQAIAIDGGWTI